MALVALRRWRSDNLFADAVISEVFAQSKSVSSARALALELFYGVLRNLTLLDFYLSLLREKHLSLDLRDIIRLGLYELFFRRTATHAAVYETVSLAIKSHRGLVNAILRQASRSADGLQDLAARQPLFVRGSHPEFLVHRWQERFGAEPTEHLCAWNNRPPPIYARINLLKIDKVRFAQKHGPITNIPTRDDFFECAHIPNAALDAGECYLQDPSTMLACDLMDPKPGDRILDACAAPGGKTGYLAQKMQNTGCIVAVDRDNDRLRRLRDNLQRAGVEIAGVAPHDWFSDDDSRKIAQFAPFDRILADVPCTNTGVMRRRVDVRWRLTLADFKRMPRVQVTIARAVTKLLKPGGTFVYSTCSLEREENQQVVEEIENANTSLRLVGTHQVLPFRDALDGAFVAHFRND